MALVDFELCAETLGACEAARDGGATRIELCSALTEDGLTPSHSLIREAIEQSGLPVHVLLRPHTRGFCYSQEELATMRKDVLFAKRLGARGVVLGILLPDKRVDVTTMREFVSLADPMKVTFHRAIDQAPMPAQALEDVIASGCHRVLTSGSADDIVHGAEVVRCLVEQAAGRITVVAGGGLTLENAADIQRRTRAHHFHASMRRRTNGDRLPRDNSSEHSLTEDIRQMISILSANHAG